MADQGTSGPPPPGGKKTGPFGKLSRDQKLLAGTVAGGGLLALLVLARRGGKGGAGADPTGTALDTTGQPYVQPGVFSDAGTGAYNNLQAEIEAITGRLDDLVSVGQPPGTPLPPPPSPAPSSRQFTVRGRFNQNVNLRQLATWITPPAQRGNPNAVESWLRRLVAANPGLRGQSSALGGHRLNLPVGVPSDFTSYYGR
jgi:hypothetical protein